MKSYGQRETGARGGRISVERFTKVGHCALTGLAFSAAFRTQGVALG